MPRLAGRQTSRNNVVAGSTSQYYKLALWYPFLDCTLQSIRDKFSSHPLTVLKLVALVPSVIESYDWPDLAESCCLYDSLLASSEEVRNEYYQWKTLCMRMPADERPSNPLQALDIVPSRLQNIDTLLRLFCTLPVSTCTPERAFSAMKILKNYLRNSMRDDRLTGLALLYVHPEIDVEVDEVIRRFVNMPAKVTAKRKVHSESTEATAVKRRRGLDG